jgi:tRNA threonylcarbamoyladenosine biosynthesis protein TsaE
MNEFQVRIDTCSVEETQRLARLIGENIQHPLVIGLTGDLGAGKTAFVQGLARGLGVSDQYYVTSPTFTLINEYPARLKFYHIDLYRISEIDEIYDLGMDELLHSGGVVAIEWADKFSDILPGEKLEIKIETVDADIRQLLLTAYGRWPVNLLKGIETKFR